MEIISANALISINATFFVQLISFLLFMFVLNKIMVSPLRKISVRRDAYIINIQNKIKSNIKKLELISQEFEKKKTKVIKDSLFETNNMKSTAQMKSLEIYSRVKNEIYDLRQMSDKKLNEHVLELRSILNSDVDSIVKLLVKKITDRRLTK